MIELEMLLNYLKKFMVLRIVKWFLWKSAILSFITAGQKMNYIKFVCVAL